MEGRPPATRPLLIPSTDTVLTFTGERFTPEVRGPIWYEHWHRYAVAVPAAAGLRVLDAACGEGYGSALLARTAAHVVGLDVDAEAVAHARERYARANLRFRRRLGHGDRAARCERGPRRVVRDDRAPDGRSARCSRSFAACCAGRRADHLVAQSAGVQRIRRRAQPLPCEGARSRRAPGAARSAVPAAGLACPARARALAPVVRSAA